MKPAHLRPRRTKPAHFRPRRSNARQLGRRLGVRRVLAVMTVALLVSTGAAAAALRIRPSVLGLDPAPAPAIVVHRVDAAAFAPQSRTEPFFVLVIGNDARAGLSGARADAIHVVGVNPAASSVTILNIPRDTFVPLAGPPIAGFRSDKINAAYQYGGLQAQMETVTALVGVRFAFVVETNFDGFMALVDDMGGLDVDIERRMFDTNSGADFQPGPNHLQGEGALSLARNRYIPDGDIARTTNQGLLLIAGLQRAREMTHSPFDVVRLLGIMARHTHYEGGDLHDLYSLATLALSIDPATVRNVTMPAVLGQVGAASVVFAGPRAGDLFADLADDAILQAF